MILQVVLAASSPWFSSILGQTPTSSLPLVYMRGVRGEEVEALLDYLYHGQVGISYHGIPHHTIPTILYKPYHTNHTQVDIPQEGLESFLALATDLSIKGLTEAFNSPNQKPSPKTITKQAPQIKLKENLMEVAEVEGKHDELDDKKDVVPNKMFEEKVIPEDYWELDQQISSMIEKEDAGWRCKICNKFEKNNSKNMVVHVEGNHIEGGAHPCTECGKVLRTRDSLRKHNSKVHGRSLSWRGKYVC